MTNDLTGEAPERCQVVREVSVLTQRYFANELAPTEWTRLSTHVRECPQCRGVFNQEAKKFRSQRKLPDTFSPEEADLVINLVHRQFQESETTAAVAAAPAAAATAAAPTRRFWRWLAGAAVVPAVAYAAILLFPKSDKQDKGTDAPLTKLVLTCVGCTFTGDEVVRRPGDRISVNMAASTTEPRAVAVLALNSRHEIFNGLVASVQTGVDRTSVDFPEDANGARQLAMPNEQLTFVALWSTAQRPDAEILAGARAVADAPLPDLTKVGEKLGFEHVSRVRVRPGDSNDPGTGK